MNDLAIVTGGTRGIGRAIVASLVARNLDVWFTYEKRSDLADAMQAEYGDRVKGFMVNCADWNAIEEFAKKAIESAAVKVLVNNAGVNNDQLFISTDLNEYWRAMALNFGSMLAFCKYFSVAMMQRRDGQIINISSVAASKPRVGNGAYGSSKSAIERFSKSLALELARFNVRVNVVAPGFVESDLLDKFLASQDRNTFLRTIPLRKVLIPQEVANTVAALAMGEIATTGSVISLGNGENING